MLMYILQLEIYILLSFVIVKEVELSYLIIYNDDWNSKWYVQYFYLKNGLYLDYAGYVINTYFSKALPKYGPFVA